MKLQIISRLQKHDSSKGSSLQGTRQAGRDFDSHTHIRNQLVQNIEEYIAKIKDSKLQHNSWQGEKSKARSFFADFDEHCVVKYQPSTTQLINPRRKLDSVLSTLATAEREKRQQHESQRQQRESQRETPNITGFTFSQEAFRETILPYQSVPAQQNAASSQDYYYVQQKKPKQRIRKFNSMISIKAESSVEDRRKPGFIMQRNLSLCRRDVKEIHLGVQESDKQNWDGGNEGGLIRVPSKERLDRVDDEISQSKERILRIRKELNEVYKSRKGQQEHRPKLF